MQQVVDELEALRLVATEARELIGEVDATGVIPVANVEALRALVFRASARRRHVEAAVHAAVILGELSLGE